MLQRVAVYHSVLQCDAVCISVLQCIIVYSGVLQCVAVSPARLWHGNDIFEKKHNIRIEFLALQYH